MLKSTVHVSVSQIVCGEGKYLLAFWTNAFKKYNEYEIEN